MNTPAHAIVNLVLLGRSAQIGAAFVVVITLGSITPDIAMMGFYAYYKLVLGAAEDLIWNKYYFLPPWQAVFDAFHSIPLTALFALLAFMLKRPLVVVFMLSMCMHSLLDLPFHHDDGHRHFFPFLQWRFESPVSYWDPFHHGRLFGLFEAACVVAGSIYLLIRYKTIGSRVVVGVIAASYAVFLYFVVRTWA